MPVFRDLDPCDGFKDGDCVHGFPAINPICRGGISVKVTDCCEKLINPPHCMREEWCGWFFPDGKPKQRDK